MEAGHPRYIITLPPLPTFSFAAYCDWAQDFHWAIGCEVIFRWAALSRRFCTSRFASIIPVVVKGRHSMNYQNPLD